LEKAVTGYMFDGFLDLYQIRIIAAIVMLGIATTMDLWKREITDHVWIGFGAFSVLLLFLEPNLLETLPILGISLIVAPLALLLWRIGFFGGADALGLIVLAGLAPMITLSEHLISPFTTLVNAAIISMLYMFSNVIRNLISISKHENIFEGFKDTKIKKILAIFLGYKAKNPRYGFSIEKTVGNHKKLNLALHNAENTEFCTISNTWITPGMPFILFISAGFLIQLFAGDIIFTIFNFTV